MSESRVPPTPPSDDDLEMAEDVLEAFNAEEVIEQPGEPPAEEPSPANDTQVPPPLG